MISDLPANDCWLVLGETGLQCWTENLLVIDLVASRLSWLPKVQMEEADFSPNQLLSKW